MPLFVIWTDEMPVKITPTDISGGMLNMFATEVQISREEILAEVAMPDLLKRRILPCVVQIRNYLDQSQPSAPVRQV